MVDVAGVDAIGPQRVALQVQRLGAVCLRDAGVVDQHVSQTAVCDRRAKTPSGAHHRVSYPVSDSLSRKRHARGSEGGVDLNTLPARNRQDWSRQTKMITM